MKLYILFLSRENTLCIRTVSFTLPMSNLGISTSFFYAYNARISKLSIDYAWSGCIVKSKPNNLPQEWTNYSENHETFSANRKIILLRHTQPVDAFALGVESLPKYSDIPENKEGLV